MLYARKTHDVNMRKQAFKVSDTVAEILRDHLAWPRYGKYRIYSVGYLKKVH